MTEPGIQQLRKCLIAPTTPEDMDGPTPGRLRYSPYATMIYTSTSHKRKLNHNLSSMLNDFASDLAIRSNVCPDLLRQRALLVVNIIIILCSFGDVQIDARAFTGEDFRAKRIFAEVYCSTIN
jgi:hypothetical protein